MEKEYYILIGILLGGLISLITSIAVQRIQSKRELYKLAFEMAKEEYNAMINKYGDEPGLVIDPLEAFVAYHLKFLKTINNKKFKLLDLEKTHKYRDDVSAYYKKLYHSQNSKTNVQ